MSRSLYTNYIFLVIFAPEELVLALEITRETIVPNVEGAEENRYE
ncbi:hypothetical protein ACJJI3_14030 [Microbulbifer sp. ZKSA004]